MGIILIVLGIFYFIKRPKIKRLQAMQYPQVPVDQFLKWQRCEILSIDIFLTATWGLAVVFFILGFAAGLSVAASGNTSQLGNIVILLTGGQVVLFLIGLIVSAIYGSTASKMRKELGIVVPG